MILKVIISIIIGAVIGLERASPQPVAKNEKKESEPHEVGVRTFSLISLLGALAGLMMHDYSGLFIIISAVFGGIICMYYFLQSWFTKDSGITTELSLLYTYVIGIMIGREILPIQIILMVAVVLLVILSRKYEIQGFISAIGRHEINAFVGYALIALVILPFLPNTDYTLSEIPNTVPILNSIGINAEKLMKIVILNPFKLWFIVALITGIDTAGYILERTIGKKGKLMSSLAGGFISSTATTQALAQESNRTKQVGKLVGEAFFANTVSYVPVFFLIGSINSEFLISLLPVLLIVIISFLLISFYMYFVYKEKGKPSVQKKSPQYSGRIEIFDLRSAITFVFIFAIVRLASQIAVVIFGSSGVFVTTSLAALTGIDASILTISQMAGRELSYTYAVWAFILINAVNLAAKAVYSFFQGKREFAVRFAFGVVVIILVSLIWPVFFV